MRKIGNRLATSLFVLLFAASLGFGVTTSFAQAERMAPAAAACPNNNDNLLGNCDGYTLTCEIRCQNRGYTTGDCIGDQNGNCCVCQL
jgi:hypothetical protein